MKTLLIFLLISTSSIALRAQENQEAQAEITSILLRQQNCWNQGDINCFMKGYWESDSLMFIGKEQVYRGFESTLQRYLKSYPDRDAMGQLTFTFKSMQALSEDAFYVVGSYHLARIGDLGDLSGHFTLLWRKIEGEWVIVADHSS